MSGADALPLPAIRAEHVQEYARTVRRIGLVLTDVRGDVDDGQLTLEESWRGDAALSCTLDITTVKGLLRSDADDAGEAVTALTAYAEEIRTARESIVGLQGRYDDAWNDLQRENGKIPPQLGRYDREEWRESNQRKFSEDVAPLRTRHDALLGDIDAAEFTCAVAINALVARLSPESMRGGAVEGQEPDLDAGAYQSVAFALNVATSMDTSPDADRRAAQYRAFVESLGRPPQTAEEWQTAAMLDPTSYLDKYAGVDAGVYVGRIEPRPGEGVVRLGWFIPVEDVFNFGGNDLGDDRGFEVDFDPEATRVAVYIDYELGLVIARNNPSVRADGEVRVGVPDIQVQQHPDGRVRLFYSAGNPFAPPGSDISGHTVHGDIVVGPDGVQGRISDYPSLEGYHDRPGGGAPEILIQDDADDWSEYGDYLEDIGPATQLPFMHDVGDDPMEAVNDFYRDDMDGGRHDYEWRNPHLRYPDGYDFTQLGDAGSPPDVSMVGP